MLNAFGNDASSRTDWWSDAGERAAILAIADEARGRPVLEIGVGGGRLVPILRLLSRDYVAIDYTPEMVKLCRRRYPNADVQLGDVRDLSRFSTGQFSLVVFTFNGIDAISHDDRVRALAEMSRVLAPDGLLVYSTHNKSGPCFRATPWHRAGPPQRYSWSLAYRAMRVAAALAEHPLIFPRSLSNWIRLVRLRRDEGDWGVGPVEAHDFKLLIHFTTVPAAVRELARAGLTAEHVFDAEHGNDIGLADSSSARYFHVVARRDGTIA